MIGLAINGVLLSYNIVMYFVYTGKYAWLEQYRVNDVTVLGSCRGHGRGRRIQTSGSRPSRGLSHGCCLTLLWCWRLYLRLIF